MTTNVFVNFEDEGAIQLLDIPLNPAVLQKLEGTFQEKLYFQQHHSGNPTCHRLQINDATQEYAIINPNNEVVPPHKAAHIYTFAIVTNACGLLELRLGLGNHYFTADRAKTVKAAGDIHFLRGKITKITNQSGGYHIETNDPLASKKQASAMAAMRLFKLPIDKFVPYKPEPILFSNPLKRSQHHTGISKSKGVKSSLSL